MPFFTTPTATGYAVAYYSHGAKANLAIVECQSHEVAQAVAAAHNAAVKRECDDWRHRHPAPHERRSVRSLFPELVSAGRDECALDT